MNSPNAMQSGTDDFLKIVNLEYTTSQTSEIFNLGPVTWTITEQNTEPIPEPTTIALLGIGIVGLACAEVRRRRKKKAIEKR